MKDKKYYDIEDIFRYRFINSSYDKDTGISKVTIAIKDGYNFIGIAKLNPDDKPNQIFGGALAELRAIEKATKHIKAVLRYQLKEVKKIQNTIPSLRDNKFLTSVLLEKENKIEKCDFVIQKIEKSIKTRCEEREKGLKKIYNK